MSEDASTTALKGMKTRHSDALSNPQSVLSTQSNHHQVFAIIQKFDIEQPRTSSKATKHPHISDPKASPGREQAVLNPSKRGATIMAPSELVPETPPKDDHSSPILGWSRSAPQDSPTLGPAFEDKPQDELQSQGLQGIPEWDDHDILEATLVNLDETGRDGYYTHAASPYENSFIEEEGKRRLEPPPLTQAINTHVSIANVPDADEPTVALPPRPRIPATNMALFSEYMGGSTLKPPTLSATIVDLCQSLWMGSTIANSHIALFELQKMKGTTLDPVKTVSIYSLVHHALSNWEEHNIPEIVASGGLPIQSSNSFTQAQKQNDHYLNEVWGKGGQDVDDNEHYDVQEVMDQMLHNQNPSTVGSSHTYASKASSKPMTAAPSNAIASGSRAVAHAAKPLSRPPSRPMAAAPSNAIASDSRTCNPAPPRTQKK
ncbi:hypothetical protein ARMGADRAFT_1036290 [Armillaria gallica]|uniref:Uncharacterized protein n=1 Tax=Armillaria gallica TaxID=47427 RepID=A0A2H3D427_ARMGA|nr:hypothetical protein ARMGADRAFT_1036290 [Armillaria gallica]